MDCHKDLCQHCIILDRHAQIYKEHLIIQKELVKEGIHKEVIDENKKAEEILKKLNEASTEQIEEKLNQLNKEKEEKVTFYRQLANSLEAQYIDIIKKLTVLKENLGKEVTLQKKKQETSRDILFDLSYNTKRKWTDAQIKEFLQEKKEYLSIETFNEDSNKVNAIIDPIQSVLNYNSFSYELKNFKELLKNKEEMLNSPEFIINFLSWQLHVYPTGMQTGKDQYLSVFIGLRDGDENEEYNYSYIIELHNFKSKKPFSSQEATKCFKPKGKFFGSEKLYLLKDLEKDGLINEKGSIIISCYIKPNSFEELNKEVEYFARKSDKK